MTNRHIPTPSESRARVSTQRYSPQGEISALSVNSTAGICFIYFLAVLGQTNLTRCPLSRNHSRGYLFPALQFELALVRIMVHRLINANQTVRAMHIHRANVSLTKLARIKVDVF